MKSFRVKLKTAKGFIYRNISEIFIDKIPKNLIWEIKNNNKTPNYK